MNQEDLDVIGVFYDTEVTAVTDLLKLLKNKKSRTSFPEVAQFFIGLTDEHLTFSLDLHNIPIIDEESAPAIEERELVEYLEEDSRNLEKFRLNEMKKWDYEKDALKFVQVHKCFPLNKRIYRTYGSSLIIKSPQLSPTPPTNERGTCRRKSVWMDDMIVGSINNTRYYEYIPRGAPNPVLMMFCEVKRFPVQESEDIDTWISDTWISRKLPKTVLEQVRTELVAECFSSAFLPNVLGVICMKTEVIFVYLTIASDHVKAIRNKEEIGNQKACIHYTEAFDIMKRRTENRCLNCCFGLDVYRRAICKDII
ncbi:unnamed protein product [Mytilus edulis]|uniref:Uncharacterized protein n=1 Tax=Mytilus edulis TaxID=6550 RepID=A0A8S3VA09_MYTED|nr:unnamed protein product [Mytilus edulis]